MGLVTGGESGWAGIRDRSARPFQELGTKVFVFGNGDDDEEYVKSLGLEFAEVQNADFVLARGMFTMQDSEDIMKRTGNDKFEVESPNACPGRGTADNLHSSAMSVQMWEQEALRSLQIAAGKFIPMLVTNPDLVRPG